MGSVSGAIAKGDNDTCVFTELFLVVCLCKSIPRGSFVPIFLHESFLFVCLKGLELC